MENSTGIILSLVSGAVMILIIAPNVFRMNHGKALQNIAIWLAIFLILGWVYQNFGPGNLQGKHFNFSGLFDNSQPKAEDKEIAPDSAKPPEMAPKPLENPGKTPGNTTSKTI